jgi:hypothetical protein
MINYFLYITGFLFGILIILIIISDRGDFKTLFKNTKEYFNNSNTNDKNNDMIFDETNIVKVDVVSPILTEIGINNNIEKEDVNSVLTNTEIIDNYNFNKLLKKKEMKVLISSYNNDNVKNLIWDTDNKNYNNNISVKLSSNDIVKEFNNLNPFVNGYNIHNVTIEGPPSFAIYERDMEINQFSILFMFMHKKFHSNVNNLFIIYGNDNKNIVINIKDNEFNNNNYYNVNNDINDNSDLNGVYDKNDINKSINLLNNYHYYENYDILSNKAKEQKSYKLSYFEKLYTIEIIIDDSIYNINDINLETLKKDITFFGLIMNREDVVFHLNNTKYEFKRNTDKDIKIVNKPFIINKNKSCEIVLYSFAYFNEAISDKDLKTFKLYNKYKLYGIYNIKEDIIKPNISNINMSTAEIFIPKNEEMDKLIDTQVNNVLLNTPKIETIIKI